MYFAAESIALGSGPHQKEVSMDVLQLEALAQEAELFIQNTIPGSSKVRKYGGVLFTLKPEEKEGQYSGVFINKNYVKISFAKGAQLSDPQGILLGKGKYRRHLNFSSMGDLDLAYVAGLLREASQL